MHVSSRLKNLVWHPQNPQEHLKGGNRTIATIEMCKWHLVGWCSHLRGPPEDVGGFRLGAETSTLLPSASFFEQIMKPICPLQMHGHNYDVVKLL